MAAKRVAAKFGTADLTLLFTDTLIEDEDLYRFLEQGAANIGVPVTKIADGRDPWQVFHDERFIGNSRIDPCSKLLKRKMAMSWLERHCDPAETKCYVGIDWTESHRYLSLLKRHRAKGWHYVAPLLDPPLMAKPHMLAALKAEGIEPPRLYAMGFAHNNCGGFCIKAGQGHFALLLKHLPERYAWHEAKEQEFRETLHKDRAILNEEDSCGKKRPLTLKVFRERIQAGQSYDRYAIGGCGCFASG